MEINYDDDFKLVMKELMDNFGWSNIDTLPDSYKDLLNDTIKALKQVKNNGVLDDVNGTCCENPKHATEVNDMFESWTYCKNCDKDIV